MEALKRCSKCRVEKPATTDFFARSSRVKSGLKSQCKECASLEAKTYNDKKFAARREQARQEKIRRALATHRICTRCHEKKPKTSLYFALDATQPEGLHCWCRECQAHAQRARYAAAPELHREKGRVYHATYRAKHGSRSRRMREEAPLLWLIKLAKDKECAQREETKPYRREKAKLRAREYRKDPIKRQKMKEARHRWYRGNPEKARAIAAAHRAKRAAIPGVFGGNDLDAAFKRQCGRCLYCDERVGSGKTRLGWHADHFIPVSRGGTNHAYNIVIACIGCNLAKHNKMPWEWKPDRFGPPNRAAAEACGYPVLTE